jgi:sister-chromatid-cohesion protein PDS5
LVINQRTKHFILIQYLESNEEWEPYHNLPEQSQEKLTGIRLLVNYLTACKETAGPEEYVINKIFSILWDMLEKSCDAAYTDKTW